MVRQPPGGGIGNGSTTPTKRYRYTEGSFAPVGYSEGGNDYTVHSDYLDTPKVLTDTSGNVVWKTVLSPYGTTAENTDSDGDGQHIAFNPRFPGQYHDRETGLYYNWNRTYDPESGRYIQSDPIGLTGGLNTYDYVESSPIIYMDPLGLAPPKDIPPGADVKRNVKEAENMSHREWYNAVRNKGKWDYKQKGSQYEQFGNYNYGATARALGLQGNIPNRGAGWAQSRAGTSDPSWGKWYEWPSKNSSFGDDPNDQYWINEGIKDFEDGFPMQCPAP